MHIRGAIHLHSTFSHDGALALDELAAWYRRHNYQFIAVTEHAEDLDDARVQEILEQSRQHSSDTFCVIPGVEFSCGKFHILGLGTVAPGTQCDALAAVETIHRCGGMAVLAHPKRFGWRCPIEILRAVDAVEFWNVGYDGKYLPSWQAVKGYVAMKRAHPPLLAIAGHDLHQVGSFYDVALEMDLATLSVPAILKNLRHGRYAIGSRFFRGGSEGHILKPRAGVLPLLSWQLSVARRARSLVLELLP